MISRPKRLNNSVYRLWVLLKTILTFAVSWNLPVKPGFTAVTTRKKIRTRKKPVNIRK